VFAQAFFLPSVCFLAASAKRAHPELLKGEKEIRDSPVVADFAVANAHVYCLEVDFPSSRCQSRNIPLYFWNNEDLV
jgi:hypothetical protein